MLLPDQALCSLSHKSGSDTLLCRLNPNQPVPLEKLRDLGVLYWKLDADNHETDPKLAAIRKARGYSYQVKFSLCSSLW